jgi:hypothetical protein
MTFQQPHDQFAKQFLSELLEPLEAEVKVNYEVHAASRYVDIYFSPKTATLDSTLLEALGLLGRMVSQACLIEPFRNPVNQEDVCNCLLKLFLVQSKIREHQKQQNKLKIQESTTPEELEELEELPDLWILSTSVSDVLLSRFGAKTKPEWGDGVYFLAEALNTRIIAINRLPKTPETLYLRMLGRGKVQKQAIEEFLALLPETSPLRQYTLKMLFMYRIYLEGKTDLTEDEKELFMNLSPAYLKWETETLQQGLQQGLQEGLQNGRQEGLLEGQRVLVENLLKSRFGVLDDALTQVIEPLLRLPPDKMSPLLLQGNRDELLAKLKVKNKNDKD